MKKLKIICRNPVLWITMLGVAFIPALYNLSFLSAMWDPYGNLKNLPVAVVNQDRASTLGNESLTIGDDMVESMRKDSNLDFHFVSAKEAQTGLEKGDYYMVVTLPEDLSQKTATLLTEEPKQAEIVYQTSKGHSFIASKMSESAMEKLKASLAEKITKQYTSAVFGSLSDVKTGMGKAADGSQQLENGSVQLVDGSSTLTSGLSTLTASTGTFSEGNGEFNSGLRTYTLGVGQLDSGLTHFSIGLSQYTNGVTSLSEGSSQLDANSGKLVDALTQLKRASDQMQPLLDGTNQLTSGFKELAQTTTVSQEKLQEIDKLVSGLDQLQAGLNQLNSQVSTMSSSSLPNLDLSSLPAQLQDLKNQVQALQGSSQADREKTIAVLKATNTFQALTTDQQAELVAAIENTPSSTADHSQAILYQVSTISQELQSLQVAIQTLQKASEGLVTLQAAVSQLSAGGNQVLPAASATVHQFSTGMNQISGVLEAKLIPGSNQITSGLDEFHKKLTVGTEQLLGKAVSYTDAVGKLNAGAQELAQKNLPLSQGLSGLEDGSHQLNSKSNQLQEASNKLLDGSQELNNGAKKLQDGGQSLEDGIGQLSRGIESLNAGLKGSSQELSLVNLKEVNAELVSMPVSSQHTDHDKVNTNGVAMAPYMISVSLMVAALSTNVIFVKSLDGENYTDRWKWAKGKLILNGFISTLAATILFLVVETMGVEANHPLVTFAMILLTGWTLMALVTALVGWNNRYGAFASLILLLLQLGSSAGTYPIELSPKFFRLVQPLLPMTYSVSALRQSISMKGQIGSQVFALTVFLLLFMVLGLVTYQKDVNN